MPDKTMDPTMKLVLIVLAVLLGLGFVGYCIYALVNKCAFGDLNFGTFIRDWADTLTHDSGQVRFRTIRNNIDEDAARAEASAAREADRRRVLQSRSDYESSDQYKEDQARLRAFTKSQETFSQGNQFGGNYQMNHDNGLVAGAPRRYKDMTQKSFGDAADLMPQGTFPGVAQGRYGGGTALDAHLSKYGERGAIHLTNHSATSLKGLRPDPPVDMTKDFGILGSAQRQNIQRGLETQGVKSGFSMQTQWDFDALDRRNNLSPYTERTQNNYEFNPR